MPDTVYVDDMSGMGSKSRIENVGRKMAGLETTKKFVFNNEGDKTEYMVIKTVKKNKRRLK